MVNRSHTHLENIDAPSFSETDAQFLKLAPANGISVRRGSDLVRVTEVDINQLATAQAIADSADSPYPADGASTILIFHTESGEHVLGGTRNNPALEHLQTSDGARYAPQISAAIGGFLADASQPLRHAVIEAVRTKMLLQADIPLGSPGYAELALLKEFCKKVESEAGWESKISIHTDQWTNGPMDQWTNGPTRMAR